MNALIYILLGLWMLSSLQGNSLVIPEFTSPAIELPAIPPFFAFMMLILLFAKGLFLGFFDYYRTIKKVVRGKRIKKTLAKKFEGFNPLDYI